MWRRQKQIDDGDRVVTDVERATKRTMDRAVRLLAAKPRSTAELRKRLLEKTWTNERVVESVIEKLKGYSYLDDEQFARELAQSKLRQKPQGERRLRQIMSRKMLDGEVVDIAVAAAFETLPETDLIDEAVDRRLRLKGGPQTRDDIKRFYDHLLRLGFSYDLVRTKMSRLVDKAPNA